ncbi:hypothetical protein HYH02_002826 [Chlamydomonas schloesseri]|uniref:Uncharacterized protein n=1 Tax=Chlamydomonas schloesseri TaxID=2026947 RepID=A0A836BB47_9CHLO|nr:hypothetical protein HYH02_002826 [Chlamydomonas schloesseri]|eukprot:KAG2452589.1 hypothetical protein HYH02_002826 [Chlamydomonas schloesseri]
MSLLLVQLLLELHGSCVLAQADGSAGSRGAVLFIEEPCVTFRSDHEVPIVADDGSSFGYATIHSDGGALLVSVDTPKAAPFPSEHHNLRAHFTRAFPRHCAMAAIGLNGSAPLEPTDVGNRYIARLAVPRGLFPCGPERGEPFFAVFFMALEVDLQPAIGAAVTTQTAGDWLGLVPPGVSCPFVTVSGACNPSACRRQQQAHTEAGGQPQLSQVQLLAPPGADAHHKRGQHHLSPSIVHLAPRAPPVPTGAGTTAVAAAGTNKQPKHGEAPAVDKLVTDAGDWHRGSGSRKSLSVGAQVWRAVASLAGALASRAGGMLLGVAGRAHGLLVAQCMYRLSPRTCARLEQAGAAAPGMAAAAALLTVALVSGLVRRQRQRQQRARRRSDGGGRSGRQAGKATSPPGPGTPGSRQLRRHLTAWPPRSAAAAVAASARGRSVPGAAAGAEAAYGASFGGSFAGAGASRPCGRSVSVSGAGAGFGWHPTSPTDMWPLAATGDSITASGIGAGALTADGTAPARAFSACYPLLASPLTEDGAVVDITCRLFTRPSGAAAVAAASRSKAASVSSLSSCSSAASAVTSTTGSTGVGKAVHGGAARGLRGSSESGLGHGPSAAELNVSPTAAKAPGGAGRAATSSADGASPRKRRVTFSGCSGGVEAGADLPYHPKPRPSKARSLLMSPNAAAAAPAPQPSARLQPDTPAAATYTSMLGAPAGPVLEVKPSPRPARNTQISLPGQANLHTPIVRPAPDVASTAARALKWDSSTNNTSARVTGYATVTLATPAPPLARASYSGAPSSEPMRLSSSGVAAASSFGGRRGRSVSLKALSVPVPVEADGHVMDAEAAAGADVAPAATASAALPPPPPPTFLRWSAGPTTSQTGPARGCASDAGSREQQPQQPVVACRPQSAHPRSATLAHGTESACVVVAEAVAYHDRLAAASAAAVAAPHDRRRSFGSGFCSGGLPAPPQLLHSAPPSRDVTVPQPRDHSGHVVAGQAFPPLPPLPPPSGFSSRRSVSLTSSLLGPNAAAAAPPALPSPPMGLQRSPSVPLPPPPPPSPLVRVLSQEAQRQAPAPELVPPPASSPRLRPSDSTSSENLTCRRAESQGSGLARPSCLPDDCDDMVRSLSCGSACYPSALPSPVPSIVGKPDCGVQGVRPQSMGSPAGSDDASCGGSGGAGTSGSSGTASPESDSPVCGRRHSSDPPAGIDAQASDAAAWDVLATVEAGAASQPQLAPSQPAVTAAVKPLPSVRLGPSAAVLDPPAGSPRAVRRSVSHTGGFAAASSAGPVVTTQTVAQAAAAQVATPAVAGRLQSAFQAAAANIGTVGHQVPVLRARDPTAASSAPQGSAGPCCAPAPVRMLEPHSRPSRFAAADTVSASSFGGGVAAASPSFRIQLKPCVLSGAGSGADTVATPVLRGARRWSLNGLSGGLLAQPQRPQDAAQQAQQTQQRPPAATRAETSGTVQMPGPPAATLKAALSLPPPPLLPPLPRPVPRQRP